MTQVSISDFRQNLPSFMDRVYKGEEFKIMKNNILMGVLLPAARKKVVKRKLVAGATNLLGHLKGSTIEIADKLRQEAWYGKYAD